MNRPSWMETYLSIAHIVAERSHDSETKVGCIITTHDNIILGSGYNGFPGGIQDCDLPTTRPGKYKYMLHAEENAVLNCWSKSPNSKAYITTAPCFACLKRLWQFGVRTIYYSTLYTAKSLVEEDEALRQDFVYRTQKRLKLLPVKFAPNLLETTTKKVVSYMKK